MVGDNINIMKTTYELNFDFYQALNPHIFSVEGFDFEFITEMINYVISKNQCRLFFHNFAY